MRIRQDTISKSRHRHIENSIFPRAIRYDTIDRIRAIFEIFEIEASPVVICLHLSDNRGFRRLLFDCVCSFNVEFPSYTLVQS